jgi:hypothetical protein
MPGSINWASLFLKEVNTGIWSPWLESLEFKEVNYVVSVSEFGPEKDCTGEAQQQLQNTDTTFHQEEQCTPTNSQHYKYNKRRIKIGPAFLMGA